MRRLVVFMTMMVIAQGAQAADFADLLDAPLRGSFRADTTRPARWDGFYVGAQAGTGAANMNFTGATDNLVANMLNNTTIQSEMQPSKWPIMGRKSSAGSGFGGFVGYNSQWDEAVLSLEASYLHTRFKSSDGGSQGRQFVTSDGYNSTANITGSASMIIHDMATARIRGGYATGNFLPYMFAGMSLGFADLMRSASATVSGTYVGASVPAPPDWGPFTYTRADQQKNQFIYGYAAGFGVDWMMFGNVFLRGEYEYLRFMTPVDVSINTIRGGVGVKF
jgi:outer membrane immunogenic protein